MKTIYVVRYDWAFNGGSCEGTLGVYEQIGDAMACMSRYWEEERRMDYFEEFDQYACENRMMESWANGFYHNSHSKFEVQELYLYSHEDVENGLDR